MNSQDAGKDFEKQAIQDYTRTLQSYLEVQGSHSPVISDTYHPAIAMLGDFCLDPPNIHNYRICDHQWAL